jgi:hypothetical protein
MGDVFGRRGKGRSPVIVDSLSERESAIRLEKAARDLNVRIHVCLTFKNGLEDDSRVDIESCDLGEYPPLMVYGINCNAKMLVETC